MSTFMHILPWLFVALCWSYIGYQGFSLWRFVKLSRQRRAVYGAAMAAYKRGDMEEFDFLANEWHRLATETERRMGIKKKADATNPFRSPTI